MAQVLQRVFQVTPKQLLYQQKRFRGKINIQHPRPTHFRKAMMEMFLTPYIPKTEVVPLEERCFKAKKSRKPKVEREINPYERIVAREAREWFDNSKLIAVFHVNSIKAEEHFNLAVKLKEHNMSVKRFTCRILDAALENSPYVALKPLFISSFGFIFSKEVDIPTLFKVVETCPQYILMAGIVDGQFLSYNSIKKYATTDITSARVELVQTLQTAGGVNLNRQLTHHQSTLVSRLKQIGTNAASETTTENNE